MCFSGTMSHGASSCHRHHSFCVKDKNRSQYVLYEFVDRFSKVVQEVVKCTSLNVRGECRDGMGCTFQSESIRKATSLLFLRISLEFWEIWLFTFSPGARRGEPGDIWLSKWLGVYVVVRGRALAKTTIRHIPARKTAACRFYTLVFIQIKKSRYEVLIGEV